jgi:putative transposase
MMAPTTVTSDGAPGLVNAVRTIFDRSIRIRCWFHRLANIRAKLPQETASEVLAHVYAVRDAPTLDVARAAADRFTNTYGREYPAAVACFGEDLDALLAIHRCRCATASESGPRTSPSARSRRSAGAPS